MNHYRPADVGNDRMTTAFSKDVYFPVSEAYFARPFGEQFGQVSSDYVHDIGERTDLRPAVRHLLEIQMNASIFEFNYEQFMSQAVLKDYVDSNREAAVGGDMTVGRLYDKCNDGIASPCERLMATAFPLDSIEVARLSHYDKPGHNGEDCMNSAVKFAISQSGGTVYEYPQYHDSKIKALDAHPVLEPGAEFVKYVSLYDSTSLSTKELGEIEGDETAEVRLGSLAARATESVPMPEPAKVQGVDFLEAMVVSIKYDIGEIKARDIDDKEPHGSKKFVVRHRQKVLIEYSKLPFEIREQLLFELKNVPSSVISERISAEKKDLSDTDVHENPLLSHLNDDSGLTNLIRRIIETEYENIELMTSIYYAVRVWE